MIHGQRPLFKPDANHPTRQFLASFCDLYALPATLRDSRAPSCMQRPHALQHASSASFLTRMRGENAAGSRSKRFTQRCSCWRAFPICRAASLRFPPVALSTSITTCTKLFVVGRKLVLALRFRWRGALPRRLHTLGKMFQRDRLRSRQHAARAQTMLELANIVWPAVQKQGARTRSAESRHAVPRQNRGDQYARDPRAARAAAAAQARNRRAGPAGRGGNRRFRSAARAADGSR